MNSDQAIVLGDYPSLLNVFLNILENTIKYSPENSDILCSVKSNSFNKTLEISVQDSGIGIAPENLEKIFNRFYRVDESRTRDSAISLGLGLPIARKVIELLGGSISVSSKIGSGTEFTIELPVWYKSLPT